MSLPPSGDQPRDADRETSTLPPTDRAPSRGLPNVGMERRCARTLNDIVGPGEQLCGEPGTFHIIWEYAPDGQVETGWTCDQHAAEVRERWNPIGFHAAGPDCGMPGSRWYPDVDECRSEGVPTAEPVRVVATELVA